MTKITDEIQAILRRGSFKDIKELCEKEDMSIPDDFTKQNAFFYLALRVEPDLQEDLLEMCEYLKTKNLDPTQIDANGQSALYYACRDGNLVLIDFLLENKVPVDHVDGANSQTALFFAARDGRLEAIRKMVAAGAKIDFLDKHQQTPLFYAASHGRDEAVKLLVELGADPSARDPQRRTPAWYARTNNFLTTEALLKSLTPTKPSSAAQPRVSRTSTRASQLKAVAAVENGGEVAVVPRASSRPSSIAMTGGGPAVPAAAGVTSRKARDTEKAAGGGVPRFKCRIVCRPVGSRRWLVADDEALYELEQEVCPELAQWTRTPQAATYEQEWSRKWQKEARVLLDGIHRLEPWSLPFHKPVDIHKMKCLNYFDVIKIPMDFSKVRQRLKDARYRKPEEFLKDMSLIFENCRRYNHATSEVAICGVKTEEHWELMVRESQILQLKEEYDNYERNKDIIYRALKGLWTVDEEKAEIERERQARLARGEHVMDLDQQEEGIVQGALHHNAGGDPSAEGVDAPLALTNGTEDGPVRRAAPEDGVEDDAVKRVKSEVQQPGTGGGKGFALDLRMDSSSEDEEEDVFASLPPPPVTAPLAPASSSNNNASTTAAAAAPAASDASAAPEAAPAVKTGLGGAPLFQAPVEAAAEPKAEAPAAEVKEPSAEATSTAPPSTAEAAPTLAPTLDEPEEAPAATEAAPAPAASTSPTSAPIVGASAALKSLMDFDSSDENMSD